MYSIYADDKLLYAPQLSTEGYGVVNPKVEVELNKAGSAEFVLPPDNVMYDKIQKLKSVINVYDDNDEIFRGRVLHDENGFYNRKNVYCEGELAFLLDSKVRPYSFKGSVSNLYRKYLEEHNEKVDPWKQFQVGEVTVTDPNDYITRESSDYPNSFDEMQAKMVDLLGGYLRPRFSEGTRYLDYVAEYGGISDQTIEFGKNLLDISEYISAEDVFTVLIPLGAEQKDEEGNSLGRLTISSVNDGKDYIENEDAIKLFGRIERVEKWDDVTVADNLISKGDDFLKKGIEMAVSLKIKAVDLHLVNVDTKRIKLGDYVRVISLPHRIDKYFLCSKISYDIANPKNTEYTFGISFASMTDKQVMQQKAAQTNIIAIKSEAQSAQDEAGKANEGVKEIKVVIGGMSDEYVKIETFNAYKQEIDGKIPTKTSDLQNDSGFITDAEAGKKYVDKTTYDELVKRVEELEKGGEMV